MGDALEDALPPLPRRHRFTADEYQRLGELGALGRELRLELLDGELIEMAPIVPKHWAMVQRLHEALRRVVGDRAIVAARMSFRLDEYSEPRPDLGVYLRRDDYYVKALPKPGDTLLLVEVSDLDSARYDRQIKLPRYARRGIPELWIVDLEAKQLHICREPRGDRYLCTDAVSVPGVVELAVLPQARVDLTDLLRR